MGSWIVQIIVIIFALGISAIPILFTAWAFSRSFRVKNNLKLLGQIRDELKALNDYNAGRQP